MSDTLKRIERECKEEVLTELEDWLLGEETKGDQLRFGNYRAEFYRVAGDMVREFMHREGLRRDR